MNHIRVFSLIAVVCLLATSCTKKVDVPVIGYLQIAQDPSLDVAKERLFQALKDSGYISGTNIKMLDHNAQGDLSMIPMILQSFVSQNVDVIVTNSTPCMIAAAKMVKDIPVVFTVSFGPVDMGVSPIPDNLYGVYDPYDVSSLVDMIISLMPHLKKIGLPYNNAERNAEFSAGRLIDELTKRDIEVVTTSVNSSNDILTAGLYLKDKKVGAIIVGADNVVNLGLSLLGKIASENRIPLFVSEPMGTYRGAALGYGVSYQHWGYESGLKVIDLLKGRDVPEAGKMESLEKMTLLINKDAANKQGLVIPDSLLKKADNVF